MEPQKQENKLQLTTALITSQKDAKAIIELPQIQENWIATYSATTGKSKEQAELQFESEKVLFMQAITANKQLQEADKFSIYSAWLMLAASGGTLRDGLCYILPFGKKAQFLPGWKFRLEQINEAPNVIHCHEPQVVYDCDVFEFEKGMKTIIKKHVPDKRTAESKITYVYFVIDFKGFVDAYIMDAFDVVKIRDQYSTSYKNYVADCIKAKVEIGSTFKKNVGSYDITIEPPMWIKDEAQAFCKTIVKRVWKSLPKLPKHKWLEDSLKAQGAEELDAEEVKETKEQTGPDVAEKLDNLILKEEKVETDNSRNTITEIEHEEIISEENNDADNPEGGF